MRVILVRFFFVTSKYADDQIELKINDNPANIDKRVGKNKSSLAEIDKKISEYESKRIDFSNEIDEREKIYQKIKWKYKDFTEIMFALYLWVIAEQLSLMLMISISWRFGHPTTFTAFFIYHVVYYLCYHC